MSKLCSIFYSAILLTFFGFSPKRAFAQVTLTSSDLLGMIGSRQTIREDGRSSIAVNVGSAGANQTWDFRNMTIANPILAVAEFLSPQSLPANSRFPTANLVEKITSPSSSDAEIYNFFRVTTSSFDNLGDSVKVTSPQDTSFVSFQKDNLAPLPITFNSTWVTTERDTTGFFPVFANISIDTTRNIIDAWGTVRLPLGDFSCLRIRQNVKVISQTILNGAVFSSNTDTYIQYNWIAKGVFLVASAQSQDGATNPNFTDAQGFSLLDSLKGVTTRVDTEPVVVPSNFTLSQNYPNPFNPETTVNYQIRLGGPVELAVFNLSGEKVRVLASGNHPAGNYEARWNGKDDLGNRVSSGVYMYRLQSGQLSETKKMIFLQ